MDQRIILWNGRSSRTTDSAGTAIENRVFAPDELFGRQGPYETAPPFQRRYIPSLVSYCIRAAPPDLLYAFKGPLIPYEAPHSLQDYDVLRDLIPSFSAVIDSNKRLDLSDTDPRLWANIIQSFSRLPSSLHVYTIALSDKYLPLLQRIPTTSDFSLLTIVDLADCQHLTDDTIIKLKDLHGLCALDASRTSLSAHGIGRLARTLRWCEQDDKRDVDGSLANDRCGPWGLRILWLDGCRGIRHDVFNYLRKFPLLSVVDLRGTSCTHNINSGFTQSLHNALYHPSTLLDAVEELSSLAPLCPSPNPFFLHINSIYYDDPVHHDRVFTKTTSSVAREDGYVVFPSNGGAIIQGNTEVLARCEAERDEQIRYERNLDRWREYRDELELRKLLADHSASKHERQRLAREQDHTIVRNARRAVGRLSRENQMRSRSAGRPPEVTHPRRDPIPPPPPLPSMISHNRSDGIAEPRPQSRPTSSTSNYTTIARELAAMVSHSQANAFYVSYPASTSTTFPRRPPRRDHGDRHLKLFRQPPPWKLLDDPPSATLPQGSATFRRTELPTFAQTPNTQAQKSVERLQDMVAQRLKVASTIRKADGFEDSSTTTGGLTKASTKSSRLRNPFMVKFAQAQAPGPEPSSRASSHAPSKSDIPRTMAMSVFSTSRLSDDGERSTKIRKIAHDPESSTGSSHGSSITKPLMPISTISVPDLTGEVKKQHAENEKAARRSLDGRTSGSGSKTTAKADTSRRSSLPASSSKLSSVTKVQGSKRASGSSKSGKVAGGNDSAGNGSGGFNWGAWSKPPAGS